MTIQQCKYVIEIVRKGSFNEAAKQLFVAQSALSNSVKLLEGELNVKIFERSKNGVFLTPEGAEFVRYAEQMVEQERFIKERYSVDSDRARLYVCTQHYDFVADVFCALLREFDEDYDFSLHETKTYEVIREVECASSDIGIIAIKDDGYDSMTRYLEKKGIAFTEFLKVSPHVFVRSDHELCKRKAVTSAHLESYPYVSYEQGAHNTSFFMEELEVGARHPRHVKISDRATLMNVLLTTDCYTVGTGVMPSALNDGKIVSLPLSEKSFYSIGYILRSDKRVTGVSSKFLKLLHEFSEKIRTESESAQEG